MKWTLQGVYDDSTLAQIIPLYEALGFKARLLPFFPGLVPGCSECIQDSPGKYRVLYTKKIDSL